MNLASKRRFCGVNAFQAEDRARFGKIGAYIIDILMSQRGNPRSKSEPAELAVVLKPTLLRCRARDAEVTACVGRGVLGKCQKAHTCRINTPPFLY